MRSQLCFKCSSVKIYLPSQHYDKVFNLSEYIPDLEIGRLISWEIGLSSLCAHFCHLCLLFIYLDVFIYC